MCYIFQENEITPIKAEEDIKVFKIGHLSCGGFMSINRGALYQFNKSEQQRGSGNDLWLAHSKANIGLDLDYTL